MSLFTDQFTPIALPHFGMVKLPSITITDAQKAEVGLPSTATNQQFLLQLARAGYAKREKAIPTGQRKEYGDRIKRELATFEELGFTDYVLLVWLVINKARELGVFIDYGRGSCAGSTVFWLLGVTGVDPIAKRLLFERFVSRVRSKKQVIDGVTYLQGDLIADADLNLGNGLEQIVEWLSSLYPGAVSKIITHGTLTGKVLINDVYKTMEGVPNEEAMRISGLVESKYGVVEDVDEAYEKHSDFKAWADKHRDTYEVCLQLRGLIRQTGVHASGYVIAPQPFDGFLPVQLDKHKEIISSYAMEDVCQFAVKLDLLGLITNRIIKEVLEQTGEDLDAINLDSDPFIYDRFQDGKLLPYGLYQIEGDCAYGVVQAIKPRNVMELSDVNAIARPGALAYLKGYIDNTTPCPHPVFEAILKPTRNLCLSGDTELFNVTDSRFYKIKDIGQIKDFRVQSINRDTYLSEAKRITAWFNNGVKEVYRLKLGDSLWIEGTADHKFLTETGWKELQRLTSNDYVATCPHLLHEGQESISDSKLRVLAYLLADGYLGGYCIHDFVNKDPILIRAYKEAVRDAFPNLKITELEQVRQVIRVSCSQKVSSVTKPNDLCQWLRELGLKNKTNKRASTTSAHKFVPSFVFGLSKEKIAFFIASLWDCDGHCARGLWMYKTISLQLAKDVSRLLLILGIDNEIYEYPYSNAKGEEIAYQITIYHTIKAKNVFGLYFLSDKNRSAPALSVSEIDCAKEAVLPSDFFTRLGGMRVASLKIGTNQNYLTALKHTIQRISHTRFRKLATLTDLSASECRYNVRWRRVIEVMPMGSKEVFDITVEDNHNFFANNILAHNCLYQEQMMHMAVAVGFSLDEAEILRKIVGKKLIDKVKEWKAKVYERVAQSKLPSNLADILWKILEDSASYSFNLSHSLATSYLTALTVYLKYKHPAQFMCACLNATKETAERSIIVQEMAQLGIKMLPADVIKSKVAFTIEDGNIRYGLEAVKGVKTYADKLASFRGSFETKFALFEAMKAAKIPINVVTGLTFAGCLDSMIYDGSSRATFALQAQLYNLLTPNEKVLAKRYADEYHHDLLALIKGIATKTNEKGKPLIQPSRMNTLRRDYSEYWSAYQAASKHEQLTCYLHERAYLGFGYSGTLAGIYGERIVGLTPIKAVLAGPRGGRDAVRFVAFVGEGKTHISAKGAPYLRATLYDDDSSIVCLLHGEERLDACRSYNGEIPKEGSIVTASGTLSKDGGVCFLDSLIEQPHPLKPKKADPAEVTI